MDIRRDVAFGDGLSMDVYGPESDCAVVIVAGYAGDFREMASAISKARLIAGSGLTAITYANRDPVADLRTLLQRLSTKKVGLWASSGNVPVALSAGMDQRVQCAALCYGYTFDAADAANKFGFVDACAGKSVDDLPDDVPLFIARAGRDEMPELNVTLDRFVTKALDRNLPITMVNHANGPHAFDLVDDSETSHEIIRQVLDFLRFQLRVLGAAFAPASSA